MTMQLNDARSAGALSVGRFQLTAAAHLVLMDDAGRILLLRRYNTGFEDGNYSVVAGHLDGRETVKEAALREAREEAGLALEVADLDVVHTMHRNKSGHEEKIDFFVIARRWHGQPTNMEPHKCDDLSWFPLDDLPWNMVPYVRHALESIRRGAVYSEFGW